MGPTPNEITAILREGKDLTVATLRPDGEPQATTVSDANDGQTIFFVDPEIVSILDDRKGFGHTERVRLAAPQANAAAT